MPPDATCQFCAIARGELPAAVVLADQDVLAFLDHRPLFPGHLLLIPRVHVETLPDLPAGLVAPYFRAAQLLTRALEDGLQAEGVFAAMNNRVSQSVPHLHLHLVPRHRGDGLRGFFWPRQKYADEETMLRVRDRLVAAVEPLRAVYGRTSEGKNSLIH